MGIVRTLVLLEKQKEDFVSSLGSKRKKNVVASCEVREFIEKLPTLRLLHLSCKIKDTISE